MFRSGCGLVFSGGSSVLVCLLGIWLVAVDFSPASLPQSSLSSDKIETYHRIVRKFRDADPSADRSVELSHGEASYLLERFAPYRLSYGVSCHQLHLEPFGDAARVRAVLRGPVGFYYRLDFTGTVRLSDSQSHWEVRTHGLRVGVLPLGWIVPQRIRLPARERTLANRVRIGSLRLDSTGLRGVVSVIPGETRATDVLDLVF